MRIAIYSRKSLETDTGESIKNQINMCQSYFDRQYENCEYEVFQDEGFSGGNTNRPAFKRLLSLIKTKQYDIVAVYKIDRIARNIVDFVNIFDEMDKYNVRLVSITEGFDPSTPAGKMMMLLLASFAEMERMNIAQRVKDNMKELAKLGRWSGGTPPSAYQVTSSIIDNKKNVYLELNKDEAPTIKYIFDKYAEGYSSNQISKSLKDCGVTYSGHTIIEILKNPTYLKSSSEAMKYLKSMGYTVYGEPNGFGFLPYNRRPRKKGVKSYDDKNKFVGVSTHEPIIDIDLWIRVHEELKKKTVNPHPRESAVTFLSGGLVKCICGASMELCAGHKRKNGTRPYYLRCSNACGNKSVRVDELEQSLDAFTQSLISKDLLERMIKDSPEENVQSKVKSLNAQISRNNKNIKSLVDKLALLTKDSSKYVIDKIDALTRTNVILEQQLLRLEKESSDVTNSPEVTNQVYKEVQQYVVSADVVAKRRLLKNIIDSISWDSNKKTIEVKCHVPPT